MEDLEKLLDELTVDEKILLVEGYKSWMSNKIERLNIPSIFLTDGPLGVRKKKDGKEKGALGLGNAYPSTAFPSSVNIANTFNKKAAFLMGDAMGKECEAYNVNVLLGPALNIKKDPRCGRNFEYFSEDPCLSGMIAGNVVLGIQSHNVAACVKHFAVNNYENYRYIGSSIVDSRALHEIYLKSFEICNNISRPKTIMCAYNQINNIHCSENKWLIEEVLRNKWGFDGVVMTDWGASKDRVKGLQAGVDLDMPGEVIHNRLEIKKALNDGVLNINDLNKAVKNMLKLIYSFKENKTYSPEELDELFTKHNEISLELALESAVLMKNDNNILPLKENEKVLVVGELFEKMRYQGAGSSNLNPYKITIPKTAFDKNNIQYEYVKGYHEYNDLIDKNLENEAILKSQKYNKILFFAGLTEMYESEGFDRKNLSLPKNQLSLIEKLSKNNDVVVVLFGGSVVELPFNSSVKAILNMFLPGQAGGEAVRRLLYGKANPSGKLSETWMRKLEDIPFYNSYSKKFKEKYKENIFVGYRYFDFFKDKILYPFGYGLSYSKFEYELLNKETKNDVVTLNVKVINISNYDGAEVIQLYVGKNENSKVFKAYKELKAFEKVFVKAHKYVIINLSFSIKDMAYFNNKVNDFIVENGVYPLYIGNSSLNIKIIDSVEVKNQKEVETPYSLLVNNSYNDLASLNSISDEIFLETVNNINIEEPISIPFTLETPLKNFKQTKMGKFVLALILKVVTQSGKNPQKIKDEAKKYETIKNQRFMIELIPNNCLRSLLQSSSGMLTYNLANALLALANGKILKCIKYLIIKEK